jgi:hypothetical protein
MLNFIRCIFGRVTLRERLELDLHDARLGKEECDYWNQMLTARIHRLTDEIAALDFNFAIESDKADTTKIN